MKGVAFREWIFSVYLHIIPWVGAVFMVFACGIMLVRESSDNERAEKYKNINKPV